MLNPSNYSAISRAIATCPETSPLARETASMLVEAWIARYQDEDSQERTLAVECRFNVRLDDWTWVIGIIDRLSENADADVIANEWKTTKAPSSWGWNEGKWLNEVVNSIQLPTYALARAGGKLCDGHGKQIKLALHKYNTSVKVRVRAVTKCSPPGFWPTQGSGLWEFSTEDLKAVATSYINAARIIRELKRSKQYNGGLTLSFALPPWQATGRQCFNQFGRDCEFLTACQEHLYPVGSFKIYSGVKLESFGLNKLPNDPRIVVLSPTSYELWALCAEKWRVIQGIGAAKRESDANLEIGTATHAGLASFYNLLR